MNAPVRRDVVVVGAGAAGMAAACQLADAGLQVTALDREDHLGGILPQCIHNGFGLHHLGRELTGPEYAEEYAGQLRRSPADVRLATTVLEILPRGECHHVVACSAAEGVNVFEARAVVLAMGSRERNRGSIGIGGTRPSGVFTAGLAQRLLNIEGYVPGRRAVIVGSGDIGLIMARRLSWVGCSVACVVEIRPYPSGITRNIVQCLQDFSIPLHLSHAVTRICGRDRVEGVDVAPLQDGVPVDSGMFHVECDTVLLSVGLVPENELSKRAGVQLSPNTGGPVADCSLQTSVPGIFACGNVLHVHDLVDHVSAEAQRCAAGVVAHLQGNDRVTRAVALQAGANLKYVVPNSLMPGVEARLLMRPLIVHEKAVLRVKQGGREIASKKLGHVRPAEMLELVLRKEQAEKIGEGEVVTVGVEAERVAAAPEQRNS
jgi:NADPH-dependent 2,4-dienoyl-CoA reductase/sulfur reductase-like enzyme